MRHSGSSRLTTTDRPAADPGRLKGIDLRHLRYFVAAFELDGFRKAAEELEVSESTISRRIRDLEDRLGASLFQRHHGGISLTHAGRIFLERARSILLHLNDGAMDVNAIGRAETGLIRIGISTSIASGFIANLVRIFGRDHPVVQLEFIKGDAAQHVTALRQLQMDVAFLPNAPAPSGCDVKQLWSERLFVALPDQHRLAERLEVQWADIADEPFVTSDRAFGPELHAHLLQNFTNLSRSPTVQMHLVNEDALLTLVSLGRGLTLTSEARTVAIYPGVIYRPIAGEHLQFSALWSPLNDNPAFRTILSAARDLSRSISGSGATAASQGTHPPARQAPVATRF